MSGSLVGGVVGAAIGFTSGNAAIGWAVGSFIGGMVFGGNKQSAPQLADLRPQASEYGRPIPIVYSVMAVGGNVIWASDLIKTSEGDDGGKGGGGSPTGATYAANFDVLICESPGGIMGLGRIWAGPDKRLVRSANGEVESGTLRFYDGAEDQLPDPLEESYLGVGNVPAYRGYARFVWEGFDVSAHDGNRIPFLTIEVGRKAQSTPATLGTVFFDRVLTTADTFIASFNGTYHGTLQHDKADMSFMHRRDISITEWAANNLLFYNESLDTLVRAYFGRTPTIDADFYSTTVMATGSYAYHSPFEFSTGDTLAGACMAQGWYCFAFNTASGGIKFRFVNPSNHTEVLGTAMEFDLSSGEQIKSIYSTDPNATWVYGVTDSKVRKYDFTLTGLVFSSQDLGVPARNTGGTSAAVDPYTGKLWTAWRDSASGNPITWSVHDQTGLVYSGELNPGGFFDLCRQPLTFAPDYVYICGMRWLAVDHFIRLDQNTGLLVGSGFDGVYHGVNDLHAVVYDDTIGKFVGYREGGLYAISTNGTNPASLPYQTGNLAGQDSSLQYMNLAEVVTDLSLRAGLTEDQIDVTELSDQVDGYTLANQVTVQDAIKALMPAYYFDAVEDQGKIRFIKRGGDIAVEIPDDDLGAHGSGEESPGHYDTNRDDDEHLPRTFSVNYVLAATKYSPATKYARRLVGNSGDEARLEMPMVFTDLKAAEIAAVNLHDQWIGRVTYRLQLGRKYAYLMPTDLVGVQGYTMRLTKQTQKDNGVQVFEAVRDDSDTYIPNVIVEETPPPDETVDTQSLTLLELLDVGMLRDADDDLGIWAATCAADPTATNWTGCTVYVSVDGGATFSVAFTITSGETAMGVTTDALADFQGNGTDFLSHVNVRLSHGTLSSTSNAGLRSGVNMAVIGDEVVFFRDAPVQDDGSYNIRTFVRGQRGTGNAKSQHVAGERFVLVNLATMTRVVQSTADLGVPKIYKAVTNGMTLASASAQDFTNEGNSLKPYPPVHLGGGRDASNNATLKWMPCARKSNEWRSGAAAIITEASEAYEVEIFTSSARTTIARTIMGLTSPTCSYSAASQTADGLTPGNTIYFRVYELSAIVGRGRPADGSI